MAKKPVHLTNGRAWSTQTEALTHFLSMLHRYADSAYVEDRADHDDLVALLERYDGAISDGPSKIGPGIDRFFRNRNVGEGYLTPGFWVRRVDGTETDFSFPAAVRGEPKIRQQEFYDACRNAVAADLVAAIRATGVDFRIGGNRAFYAPGPDFIMVPPPQAYFEPINWHRTALHELGHASGHPCCGACQCARSRSRCAPRWRSGSSQCPQRRRHHLGRSVRVDLHP